MPVTYDDAFFDDLGSSLPDCSVLFLCRVASWSARNSKSGFVPNGTAARHSDNPDLVTRTLRAAGLMKRVKGGHQIAEGMGITIVNASDVEAQAAAEAEAQAEAAARAMADREAEKLRKRAYRADKKAERVAVLNAGVNNVPRDNPALSRGTKPGPTDRSDQDLNQSGRSPGQPVPHDEDPGLLRAVAGEFGKLVGRILSDAEAATVVRTLTRRADDAGTVIRDPERYFVKGVRNAREPIRLLDGDPPPWKDIVAGPIDPDEGKHPFVEGEFGRCARCQTPASNRTQHHQPKAETA